jgi:HK97 family phage portal protein
MANWLTNLLPWGKRAVEGQYRPGPYWVDDPGGGLITASAGRYWNWWQTGYKPQPYGQRSAMVEACVSAYSQTVAMCPGDHWRRTRDGGRERVTTSALQRIIKTPNDYESISDFMMNLTRRLYDKGEVFAVAQRNARSEITELHLMRSGIAMIGEDGSVFYSLWGNEIAQRRFDLTIPAPARDVLHVRLHTPVHPLKGVSPILAAALELAMSTAALSQQLAFYLNMARPSYMLETDQPLTRQQVEDARSRWDDQTQGENAGNSPILTHGLKAKPAVINAVDSQLAEILKMSDQNIALALRIPLQIFGLGGTTYNSTELLMQSWIASGLGFALNHIEEAFGQMFGLGGYPDEYLEFDTKALLRSAYRERIEALARGVISGIYSPDEARASEDLPKVKGGYGDMPRVQQQVVPLSYGAKMEPPSPPPATPPTPPPAPTDGGDPNATDEQQQQNAAFRAAFRASYDRHRLAA